MRRVFGGEKRRRRLVEFLTAVDNENKLMCNKGGPKIPMYICTFGHAAVAEFLVGLLMDGRKVFDKIL